MMLACWWLQASAEKRKAAMKRKLGELQQEASAAAADLEQRVSKMKSKTNKVPDLLQIMQQFMEKDD